MAQPAGVLLMNGQPATRTFREAALRAGPGRVMAEVEAEQVCTKAGLLIETTLDLIRSSPAL